EHGTEAGLAQAQDDLPVPEPQPVRQPHRRRALPLACRRGVDAGDQDQLAGLAGAPLDGVQVDLGLVATVGLDLVLAEAQLRRHVDDRPELRCLRDLDVRQHRSPLLHRSQRRRSAPDAGYCGTGGERTRSSRPSLPAMALPHRTLLLPYVRNATTSIESALARASARSRLAPLVRALGLEPRKAPIPPDARGAFALAGAGWRSSASEGAWSYSSSSWRETSRRKRWRRRRGASARTTPRVRTCSCSRRRGTDGSRSRRSGWTASCGTSRSSGCARGRASSRRWTRWSRRKARAAWRWRCAV